MDILQVDKLVDGVEILIAFVNVALKYIIAHVEVQQSGEKIGHVEIVHVVTQYKKDIKVHILIENL